jgi:hypothetical protein
LIKTGMRGIINKNTKGVIIMSESRREYKRLDMSKLVFADRIVPMEEALKDVTPIEWSDDVLSGKKKVVVTNAEKDYKNRCVKLEISC